MWKIIPSYPNYEASDLGEIRHVPWKNKKEAPRIRKQFINQFGYYTIGLNQESKKQKTISVHILIAEAFLGIKPKGLVVNHKDGIKTNNKPNNLEYVTSSYNNIHALKNNLRKVAIDFSKLKRGEDRKNTKITKTDVINIWKLRKSTGYGYRRIAKQLHIPAGAVDSVLMGKSWKHVSIDF